jgi:hypothetical protein
MHEDHSSVEQEKIHELAMLSLAMQSAAELS